MIGTFTIQAIKPKTPFSGATENAGVENAIQSKMQGWKMQQ